MAIYISLMGLNEDVTDSELNRLLNLFPRKYASLTHTTLFGHSIKD